MTAKLDYPDTQYSRTLASQTARAPLTGSHKADVVIIGGGFAGLTLARELAEAGRKPVLLEARSVAFGASGRNGGFVSPGYANGDAAIARRAGRETADALFRLSLEAVDRIRARIASYGPEAGCDQRDGLLRVQRIPGGDLRGWGEELRRKFGYETTYLGKEEIRARAVTKKYFEALHSVRSFHIHPLNYARALAAEAERLGAVIHEASPAESLTRTPEGWLVTTPEGRITAETVAITTGGYTGPLVPRLKAAYVPVATYVMASEAAPELLSTAIRTRDAIGDNRRAGDYYRLIEDGTRLLWGGAITVRDRNPAGVHAYLRKGMVDTFPQLAPLKFEVSWSGMMSYAGHRMPQIGRLQEGLWYATAFGGHGVNTTDVGARMLAEGILGQSDRYRLFAPWGLDFTGGPIGKAAAQATYWWLSWQDRRAEAAVAE